MRQVKVLLVDDSAEFLASASDFLSRDPRVDVVGQAHDGDEGVRMAAALAPDIVLMDLVMPVLNGLEATRRMKVGAASPHVVIVSMYDDPGIRQSAMRTGADGFICKTNFAELALATIDAYVAGTASPANAP